MLHGATVVFDLDGTMIDTAPDLIHAANHALTLENLSPVAPEVIHPAVGIGARAMVKAAVEAHGQTPSEEDLTRMTQAFQVFYADNVLVDSRPYPGLLASLDALAAQGAILAVCTNKREAMAKKLLGALALADRFAFIAGRETFPVSKPDPGHILETVRAAGGDSARAVMIGDSSADAAAAHGVPMPFVAVTFGYGERPVEVLRPRAVIDHFDDLLPALRAVL